MANLLKQLRKSNKHNIKGKFSELTYFFIDIITNNLPTKSRLSHITKESNQCPRCKNGKENLIHIFIECPITTNNTLSLDTRKKNQLNSIEKIIFGEKEFKDNQQIINRLIVLRSIWLDRCDNVLGNTKNSTFQINLKRLEKRYGKKKRDPK